jgi:hypothetical protein
MENRKRPWQHKAKVVWVVNGVHHNVDECHAVAYPIARQYVRENKQSNAFRGGVLLCVSMQANAYAD